jgi:hypothetical protein
VIQATVGSAQLLDWLRSSGAGEPSTGVLPSAAERDELERAERDLMRARFDRAREQIALAREQAPPPSTLRPRSPRAGGDRRWPPSAPWAEVTPELMMGAIEDGGCLWVRNLLAPALVRELVAGVDRAFSRFDELYAAGRLTIDETVETPPTGPWYSLFLPEPAPMHALRPWARADGGLYTGDSPRFARTWFDTLRTSGLLGCIARIFGERPVTSLDKAALRRVAAGTGIEWHQDGAFLGPDTGAINVWVALTDCTDAPGLEIVPRRLEGIVETGTGGATYDWSVGPDVVAELTRDAPVARPAFRAGDALVFDGMLLHRTAQEPPPLPRVRHAIETWFFRPSRFPAQQQVPLAF